jgi:sterol desaturase/sphingolipid hydroxylase (fatty acid hydroxylase superfamily)
MKVEYARNASERMFENDFLEACSKIHPSVPFVFYIPTIIVAEGYALALGVTSVSMTLVFIPLGFLTWQLLEYGIHRGFFHWEGNGPFTRRLHEVLHEYHHRYPDDAKRLVMPLGASIPLAIIIAGLLYWLHRPGATVPYFFGVVSGYLFYDFMHWSVHYREPWTSWGRALRRHHMSHHFADPTTNFGISHRWIDRVVGSLRQH